ncbi:hypothetical protein HHK36_026894 [Tetracentron sinense]|uniref:Uncharacterized protein n=1 Tax=Tetracentron sinense TaxID=13715 RepID=A0A835D2M5_TETSI|nr:hypothetical protein HHK36_026894 [Tetracentron sinense]
MHRSLFLRIIDIVKGHDNSFIQKKDGIGRLGLSTLQKVTAVFRILAASADFTNEYVRIDESTVIQCMKKFCPVIVEIFGEEYLGSPNANDVARLLQKGRKKKYFAMMQETHRKDVGVLQSQIAIVKGPSRFWDKHVLHDIMFACIIMHNMIVEDECDGYGNVVDFNPTLIPNVDMVICETEQFQLFLAQHWQIKNKEAHYALRNSLIKHLWERHGDAPFGPDLSP